MKYIISLLLLSVVVFATPIHFDIEYTHQQNTDSNAPIIYESPKPNFDEIYVTPTPTVTPQTSTFQNEPVIVYSTNDDIQNILLPPIIF